MALAIAMESQHDISPMVLSPATPSELLSNIIGYYTYPTTILICLHKQGFINLLVEDVTRLPNIDQSLAQEEPTTAEREPRQKRLKKHSLLKKSLLQTAISRHIRVLFIPTVTHLRAYLSSFSQSHSPVPPPPNARPAKTAPLLLVYGFLDLHRDGSEWSAQGLGFSAACFVEAASRNAFKAAIVEPTDDAKQNPRDYFDNLIPLLNGTPRKEDGTWSGRSASVRRVLSRWFVFKQWPHE